MILRRLAIGAALLLAPAIAWAQGALLQGGPITPGNGVMVPQNGFISDQGLAGSFSLGQGVSETLQVNRTALGHGPLGTHNCDYAWPNLSLGGASLANTGGYYYLCWDASANGGGILASGAGGAAVPPTFTLQSSGPLNITAGGALSFTANGVIYPFPFTDTTSSHVPTQAALAAYNTAATTLIRDGFVTPGDSPAITYTLTNSPCTLNAGAGDSGSQVPYQNTGTGKCWIANLSGIVLSPMVWGAAGNGTADDTTAVQAAINSCGTGFPLTFDAAHLYKITTTLNITSPCIMQGPYRYGIWAVNQPTGSPPGTCPWGLVTRNTGITMINAAAITGTISNLCIDMTGDGTSNPGGGAAIQIKPPSIVTYSSGWTVSYNTILQPYDGITVPGNGPGTQCCGIGTSADGDVIEHNTIISPTHAALSFGANSAAIAGGPGTVGITVTDNDIACKTTTSKANAYGIVIYEGAIWYDGSQNGPEGCHVGTAIIPGTLGGDTQYVTFNGDGVFGDQSGTYNLLIQPASGGYVYPVTIGGRGPWANTTTSTSNLLIDGRVGGVIEEVAINGIFATAGGSATSPALDIEGGTNGPFDVHVGNSLFCGQGAATGTTAIKLNAATGATGRWTIEGNHIGTGCLFGRTVDVGISLTISSGSTANGAVTIVGNDISVAATPISYTPNANDNVIIRNNMGLDNVSTGVTVNNGTTSITPPGMFYGVIGITGSGSPTLTTMPGGYSNQHIEIINGYAGTVSFGTGASFCNTASITQQQTVFGRWNPASNCWNLK